jgi:hypothetical protein
LLLGGCAAAQHPVLRENDRLIHAIAAHDMQVLDALLAPDFRFEAADGSRGDRSAWIEGVRGLRYQVLSITTEQLKLNVTGVRAELCGTQRATVLVERKPLVDEAAFCDRWERRGERWWLTFAGLPAPGSVSATLGSAATPQ